MKSDFINACSPIVAVVDIIIEFDLNTFLFKMAFSFTFILESYKKHPFDLISSNLNQGIVPFSQNSLLFLDGVNPFLISKTSFNLL